MEEGKKRTSRRWRAVALIALGIAVGVTMMATPATAHVTGSLPHLVKHMKKVFYTKKQSNNRYLGKGAKAADAELLDGIDSTGFYAAGSKVADAELLDGVDSAAFQRRCQAGGVTAYAYVDVDALLADTAYHDLTTARFTCANTTNTVRAKRTNGGRFTVDFGYNFSGVAVRCPTVAIGTIAEHAGGAGSIRVDASTEGGLLLGDCVYNVQIFNPSAFVNDDFTIAQLDTSTALIIP